MNAYSLDLRKKIVQAKQRGTPTAVVARTFGVDLSTVKRYAATAREGKPLAPKKRPGSKPKLDEAARKLLGADLQERLCGHAPAEARVSSACGGSTGERFHRQSDARTYGMEPKKRSVGVSEREEFLRAALEGYGRGKHAIGAIRVRRGVFDECFAASAVRLVA